MRILKSNIAVSGSQIKPLSLVVSSSGSGPQRQFSAASIGGVGPYSYTWDFGDGSTSSDQNPVHSYANTNATYTVTCTVTDSNSNTETATESVQVQVGSQPLSLSINSSVSGATVALSANVTGGTSPYSYLWDLLEGRGSFQRSLSRTFNTGGTKEITCTVTDAIGNTVTETVTVDIQIGEPELSGSISVSGSGSSPNFSAQVDGGVAPYIFAWNFGDGNTSTAQNPSHTYAADGSYNVQVEITDSAATPATLLISTTVLVNTASTGNVIVQGVNLQTSDLEEHGVGTVRYAFKHVSNLNEDFSSTGSTYELRSYLDQAAADTDTTMSAGTVEHSGPCNPENLHMPGTFFLAEVPSAGKYFRIKVVGKATNGQTGSAVSPVYGPTTARAATGTVYTLGTSPGADFTSLAQVNAHNWQAGQVLEIERDTTWLGMIDSLASGVTVRAEDGPGRWPRIWNGTQISGWTQTAGETNIWEAACAERPYDVLLDGRAIERGVFPDPDYGLAKIQSSSGKTFFRCDTIPDDWNQADLVGARMGATFLFHYYNGDITGYDGNGGVSTANIGFGGGFDSQNGITQICIYDTKLALRSGQKENTWAWNGGKLYLYSSSDPNEKQIVVSMGGNYTSLWVQQLNNIKVEKLNLLGGQGSAIHTQSCNNSTIRGVICQGGSEANISSRYATGMQFYSNIVLDANTYGIWCQNFNAPGTPSNHVARYNAVIRCGSLGTEAIGGVFDLTGILFQLATESHIDDNFGFLIGNNFARWDEYAIRRNCTMDRNEVHYSAIRMMDYGGLYTMDYMYRGDIGSSNKCYIRDNVLYNTGINLLESPRMTDRNNFRRLVNAIYIDDGTVGVDVLRNHIINSESSWIYPHNVQDIVIQDNKASNPGQYGFAMVQDNVNNMDIRRVSVVRNSVVQNLSNYPVFWVWSRNGKNDENQFSNSWSQNKVFRGSGNPYGMRGFQQQYFDTRVDFSAIHGGYDSNGEEVVISNYIHYANGLAVPILQDVPAGTWRNENGQIVTGQVTIPAHGSVILYQS